MFYTDSFEMKLAYHSAPSLLGIKPANLFSVTRKQAGQVEEFNMRASHRGFKIRVMCECNERVLVILYNEKMLSTQLDDPVRKELLDSFGYAECKTLEAKLDMLSKAISSCDGFPHEIGLFLGYPVPDVTGFIENAGRDYIFSGYWKVYHEENKARRTFGNYEKCRKFLVAKLSQGKDIYEALKIA
ncbi:MAG: DUF3793 family protein [Oscillospiraceae bacterium]|nr:DUF3793 family protein [Oscillospiraceae bacterium]